MTTPTAAPRRSRLALGLLVGVTGALALGFVATRLPSSPPTVDELKVSAEAACRRAVMDNLHDPKSAELLSSWASFAGGEIAAGVRLRARNGFGALRLATMTCTVAGDGRTVLAVQQAAE